MKYAISALMLTVFLSGCANTPSNPNALILPDIVEYTPDIQDKAASEIELNYCPILSGFFMPDYSVMRDQTRVAKGELK